VNAELLRALRGFVGANDQGAQAVAALQEMLTLMQATPAAGRIGIDASLARGLSYYTGAIMEVAAPGAAGSLGGGGRYDNLIGMFLGREIPACGFSLGLERMLVLMDERGMFPPHVRDAPAQVLVVLWNAATMQESLQLARELREGGLRVDLYPEPDGLSRQFKYAARRGVPVVVLAGDDEQAAGQVTVKTLATGEQVRVPRADLIRTVTARLELVNTPLVARDSSPITANS